MCSRGNLAVKFNFLILLEKRIKIHLFWCFWRFCRSFFGGIGIIYQAVIIMYRADVDWQCSIGRHASSRELI